MKFRWLEVAPGTNPNALLEGQPPQWRARVLQAWIRRPIIFDCGLPETEADGDWVDVPIERAATPCR